MLMDTAAHTVLLMKDLMAFAKFERALDAAMARQNMNDASLSKAAALSPDYVNKLRKRKSIPKLHNLRKIAEVLGVEPEVLFAGAGKGGTDRKDPIDHSLLRRCLTHVLEEAARGGMLHPAKAEEMAEAAVSAYQAFQALRRQPAKKAV